MSYLAKINRQLSLEILNDINSSGLGKKVKDRGGWMPQSDFSSGHNLVVCEFQPSIRVPAVSVGPLWVLCLPLYVSPSPTLPLSKINESHLKRKVKDTNKKDYSIARLHEHTHIHAPIQSHAHSTPTIFFLFLIYCNLEEFDVIFSFLVSSLIFLVLLQRLTFKSFLVYWKHYTVLPNLWEVSDLNPWMNCRL